MIPVVITTEPASFEKTVRQPGLAAIDEMVGLVPPLKRKGRRRQKIANTKSDIPADKFPPFWRKCIDEMMRAYNMRCAYLAMHIEYTGNPTVDHVIPKSLEWSKVYEWSNYRLCAGVVNSKKGNLTGVVDPVDADIGWFELDLASYCVVRGANAPVADHAKIDATLSILNQRDCWKQRQQYVEDYLLGPGANGIDITYLERRAPFIASELRRQKKLARGDK